MPDTVAIPRAHATGARRAPILNALTIDVEDYYQVSAFEQVVNRDDWHGYESRVVASTGRILRALERAEVRATFFILGYVADQHPDLVRAIQRGGHEIACHGYWHRLIYQQTPAEFRTDIVRARDLLQDIAGVPVTAYRAPSFSITRRSLWALDVLLEEGFTLDSSIYPTVHDRYGIAGAPLGPHRIARGAGTIAELPPPVWRLCGWPLPVGGGGYFRLYPYMFTRWGIQAVNAAGRPAAIYLHPWELDPDQPRLNAGLGRRFRHYLNLHRTENRLEQLLRDFPLGTLSDAFEQARAADELPTWDLTRID